MKFKDILNDMLNEKEIWYIGTVDGYRISVEGSEGNNPHIHCIKGKPAHPEVVSCISLKKLVMKTIHHIIKN